VACRRAAAATARDQFIVKATPLLEATTDNMVEDATEAHVVALAKAKELGFDTSSSRR
jgi:hypothetical protein